MSLDAPQQARSIHGAILGVDIEGYARPDRNDPDRVHLRSVLQGIVWQAVTGITVPARCRCSDTGDGLFIVFPSDMQKTELIVRFIPTLEQLLLEHNRRSADHMKFRIWIVLEVGEVLLDQAQLTGEGLVGAGLNTAARLLESNFLRSALRRSSERHPLALLVSDTFYHQVVRGQLAIFQEDYECHRIRTKGPGIDCLAGVPRWSAERCWRNRQDGSSQPDWPQATYVKENEALPDLGGSSQDLYLRSDDGYPYPQAVRDVRRPGPLGEPSGDCAAAGPTCDRALLRPVSLRGGLRAAQELPGAHRRWVAAVPARQQHPRHPP